MPAGRCDALVHGTCGSGFDGRTRHPPFKPAAECVHKDYGEAPQGDGVLEDGAINWWQLAKEPRQSRDARNDACSPQKKRRQPFFCSSIPHFLTTLVCIFTIIIMDAPPPLRVQISGILLSTLLFECANARVDYVRWQNTWLLHQAPHQAQCPTPRRVWSFTAT